MFFVDQRFWTAAFSAQRQFWNGEIGTNVDRDFVCALIAPKNLGENVWDMTRAYKVARNFPKDIRKAAIKTFSAATVTDFDSFVMQVRNCTNSIKKERQDGNNQRNSYAISGVSKVLWHRFPHHGFIFDDQARGAMAMNGLGASFHNYMQDWGGEPREDIPGDCNFLTFAASYKKYCKPMYRSIKFFLDLPAREPTLPSERGICTVRVVDKLLWLAGEEQSKRETKISSFCSTALPQEQKAGKALAVAAGKLLG